jgi:hypothetical protein
MRRIANPAIAIIITFGFVKILFNIRRSASVGYPTENLDELKLRRFFANH